MILSRYYPYAYVEDVFSIDYARLYGKGFRAILFDIDNTLVPHGADSVERVDQLFKDISSLGFKTLLLSNNSEERVKRFKKNIDTQYIFDANKPEPEGFIRALDVLNVKKGEAIVIGDQLFTDIYGANRCGIPNILVKYIGYYKKEWKGITRNIEKIILFFYSHSKKWQKRLDNIQKNN